MHINNDIVEIVPISKIGTNDVLLTECCFVAICDDQLHCPQCGRKVIGCDAQNDNERSKIRWNNAKRLFWR